METVYLPLQEAIALEAKQNFERDQRVIGEDEVMADVMEDYIEEAAWLMESGEGYHPEFPDHKLVKVLRCK